ncbi:transposase for insertion sequence element IS257 in transposon Tn4003 [Trichonephila clavata]|uniref:Transposase for insertion sequence element IS257 in transposon Tn4003 n=1 Tax=Trichonephila clavata TaxID=2740835 RepID=A0A8X6HBU6_TRICU|nr:transposase for insertion sequence element IS257 in transposon Tn4003 [Trichonephila clavata]
MISIRGAKVDHATLQRWVIRFVPLIDESVRKRKKQVGSSWRMDETYIKLNGKWVYLYRALDSLGNTVDFLLCARRDKSAALAFFRKAFRENDLPEKVVIDKSGSNTAALDDLNREISEDRRIMVFQIKYLNNIVEQDHRFIKKRIRPMLGFKSFHSAKITITGIENIHATEPEKLAAKFLHINSLSKEHALQLLVQVINVYSSRLEKEFQPEKDFYEKVAEVQMDFLRKMKDLGDEFCKNLKQYNEQFCEVYSERNKILGHFIQAYTQDSESYKQASESCRQTAESFKKHSERQNEASAKRGEELKELLKIVQEQLNKRSSSQQQPADQADAGPSRKLDEVQPELHNQSQCPSSSNISGP